MKKLFTLFASALLAIGASATDYTDQLVVSVSGVQFPGQETTITLNQQDNGNYQFLLKDFTFSGMPIGDIQLDDVPAVTADGITTLWTTKDIVIANLGEDPIPVTLRGELRDGKLYAAMDIYFAALEQNIQVAFGTGGYQIPNSGFEDYYTYTNHNNIQEPLHWHSFASCKGSQSGVVSGSKHTEPYDEVRPGTGGEKSLRLTATRIALFIANGTVTNGRMNAGSMSASNTANHAEMSLSDTDTDGNGDPFYTVLNGRPDSLTVWVKFNQGRTTSAHPYATVSSYITDGTYFQDPQDRTYNNVAASARDNRIAATGSSWRRISVPFAYNNGVTPKAILVTMSTNADAGQGSNGDELLIDDLSLIYNPATATAITVKGDAVAVPAADGTTTLEKSYGALTADDITVATSKANAKVFKTLTQDGNATTVRIDVTSEDLVNATTYYLSVPSTATAVRAIDIQDAASQTVDGAQPTEAYTLSGQRVSTLRPGKVYILRQGTKTVKVLK